MHGRDGQVLVGQLVQPGVARLAGEDLGDAVGGCLPALTQIDAEVGELRPIERRAQARPEFGLEAADADQLAVAAAIAAIASDAPGQGRLQHPATTGGTIGPGPSQQGQGSAEHRLVDPSTTARAEPAEQRREHGRGRQEPGQDVGDQHPRDVAAASVGQQLLGQLAEQPGQAGDVEVVGDASVVVAKGGQRARDQARVGLHDLVEIDAPAGQGPGSKALEKDVGAGQELAQVLDARARAQVEAQRLGPAVVDAEPDPDAADQRRGGAHGIADPGVLDLDQPSAEIEQVASQHRTRGHPRAVDHQHALERERLAHAKGSPFSA